MKRRDVVAQLRALGVADGDVLLVHTSFRAVRPVEGGPAGLISALQEAVGPAGTTLRTRRRRQTSAWRPTPSGG